VRLNYLVVASKHQALVDIRRASLLFDVALLHRMPRINERAGRDDKSKARTRCMRDACETGARMHRRSLHH
jgi:hypothetical protein